MNEFELLVHSDDAHRGKVPLGALFELSLVGVALSILGAKGLLEGAHRVEEVVLDGSSTASCSRGSLIR